MSVSRALIKRDEHNYPEEYSDRVPKKIRLLEDSVAESNGVKVHTFKKGEEIDNVWTDDRGLVYIKEKIGFDTLHKFLGFPDKKFEIIEWHSQSSYYDFLFELKELEQSSRDGDVAFVYSKTIEILGEDTFNGSFNRSVEFCYENDYPEDDFFPFWHKSFRQGDVADGILRKEDGKESIGLNGQMDALFHSIIHIDSDDVLYKIFNKVAKKLKKEE